MVKNMKLPEFPNVHSETIVNLLLVETRRMEEDEDGLLNLSAKLISYDNEAMSKECKQWGTEGSGFWIIQILVLIATSWGTITLSRYVQIIMFTQWLSKNSTGVVVPGCGLQQLNLLMWRAQKFLTHWVVSKRDEKVPENLNSDTESLLDLYSLK